MSKYIIPQKSEALVRCQSWSLEVSPQRGKQILEQEKLRLKDTFGPVDSSCKVTVLRRSTSDRFISIDSKNPS